MSRASDEKKLLYVFLSVTLSKSYYAAWKRFTNESSYFDLFWVVSIFVFQ